MSKDEIFMRRCIQLARSGQNHVAPNPMVGAVIVHDDVIIGEGYHVRCGEAHAEVNAVRSVKNKELLAQSTIYVSLEPCSHYGKTPPCVDLILERQIPRVVIGCQDPFEKVAGRSIQKLREAGRQITVGVLEQECHQLISHFITFNRDKRPYIILKWAESIDGFIDRKRTEGAAAMLSTELTSMLVHKRRAEADAIMVGTRTALLDNPSLTVRHWHGKSPIRVVTDRHSTLPRSLQLFDGKVETLVYSSPLTDILSDLYQRGIQTLLIEGGSQLLQAFIEAQLWDEAFIEKSKTSLKNGVKAPQILEYGYTETERHFGVEIVHFERTASDSVLMAK
ncbi:bifunctional diaminohydroxyphosphoribosylaminopyrimidine deaminase/5-amino-6-(5-phosphoribosylamino)uracil reductase RibD [Bacteroides sp. 214]|uniref:bifunctional diaminohydroxyphosphoribosylaminopyrimidine deaminase/5-amino-6-(5-phosphoribosylamino)uracil reductase RibD n=1 Tax=Bacteroides sp. 214 TaxID=2302935 RepID=UPI0013D03BA8|nr:bifunctional diaminohydroxyphosphoribosylaminopyrimidine deaminase/5-amino-6-(5-phosphoribosylamino)uracil reductase RibD [Bacteroides sp. 214]NDW12595.1 bifunctional diaminohydroxyphosphoribosylaminopyrimidine deaminase/5-amino-6-(5-phosphoribosylamino)uracil reductase RibD [Bacteroides sp. 214]